MFDTGNFTLTVVIIIAISIVVILILREFWCWYTKQNKIVSLLEEISQKLNNSESTKTIFNNSSEVKKSEETSKYKESQKTKCEYCGQVFYMEEGNIEEKCPNCQRLVKLAV